MKRGDFFGKYDDDRFIFDQDETDSKMEDAKKEEKPENDDSTQPGYEPVEISGGIRRLVSKPVNYYLVYRLLIHSITILEICSL